MKFVPDALSALAFIPLSLGQFFSALVLSDHLVKV